MMRGPPPPIRGPPPADPRGPPPRPEWDRPPGPGKISLCLIFYSHARLDVFFYKAHLHVDLQRHRK